MLRPSPEPTPGGLVEKNGSVACATTSGAMPVPVSVTASTTWSPDSVSPFVAASVASRCTLAVETVSPPPRGMASRALSARLSNASPICEGSALTIHRSGARVAVTWIVSPRILRSIPTWPCNSAFKSMRRGCNGCCRAKASRRRVSSAPLKALLRISRVCSASSRPVLQRVEQDLGVANDHAQQVIEVVRDTAGELADRLQLQRMA